MTGNELKVRLMEIGKSQKDVADLLGVTAQSLSSVLSAKDVRSGTIEKIAHAVNMPISFFYGETNSQHAMANGDSSVAAINSHVDGNAVLQERVKSLEALVEEKERTIKILMEK